MHMLKPRIWFFLVCLFFSASTLLALPIEWPKDGIVVQPDIGRAPLIAVFRDAKESLQISAYILVDEPLIAELAEAVKRGVKVDVLVTKSVFKRAEETKPDETPFEQLEAKGINVRRSPEFYAQTHHKLIIVDGSYALIGTGNMAPASFDEIGEYKAGRDFWIAVTSRNYIQELKEVFLADFNGERTDLKNSLLVWGPDQGRAPFVNLIKSAKKNILVYQQDISDKEIADALAEAACNGIDVRLMMMPYPFSKTVDKSIPNQEMIREAGGKVGMITHVAVHAKVILVDVGTEFAKAWLGSTNFYPSSLDRNRELGIITQDASAIDKIKSTFEADWLKADFKARK